MPTVTLQGRDTWCFGVDFFIQAALFQRTAYADWEIIREAGEYSSFSARRAVMIGRDRVAYDVLRGGRLDLGHDGGYSWHFVWKQAQAAVSRLDFEPLIVERPGAGTEYWAQRG
jgi:hypothetical protein